jgi:maltose O-acetyltransferase
MINFQNLKRGAKNTPRYIFKRLILFLVNILAGDPEFGPLNELRRTLLKLIHVKIGPESQISENLHIYDGRRISIGKRARIGSFCKIFDFSEIVIGDNLLASHSLTLISATHSVEDLSNCPGPITIGDNVWIGINVTIVGPVTIGSGSVIGAGSVVLKDIPENVVAAGTPAKIIRKIERP